MVAAIALPSRYSNYDGISGNNHSVIGDHKSIDGSKTKTLASNLLLIDGLLDENHFSTGSMAETANRSQIQG